MAHSESERRSLKQMRMFDDVPEEKLRVRITVPNEAALDIGLRTRWNMRVPESSILFSTVHDNADSDTSGDENLSTWTFSSGDSLMDYDVFIQARRIGDSVMATIQPRRGQ
ncbi:hypothetical protein NHH03_25540 [Stieleria sp. TO1_6]|uniref:hypothetical protein n=1 Tax=Stieleria tagensis TaxID=2956795 RepID=UPI00209A8F30|nr:hypothetical protein [Stieleria tagensis]MCO8125125.1 hypothetical protein [Stieleria tagensis]